MTYRRIRSLSRGVEVLRYLNTVEGAHPVDIGKQLGLPRPTVHRILETLEELKLVYKGAYSHEFRLTPGVRQLASGEDQFSKLREIAWPIMRKLTAEIVWPSDLAVFHDDAMLIIESTHRLSPISSEIGMVGQSRGMFVSPLGRAYLSHSSKKHRDMIVARLQATDPLGSNIAGNSIAIEDIVEDGLRDGVSICGDLPHERRASMAAAIRVGEDVVACINIVWKISDLTFQEARDHLATPLLAARDRIEARLREASAPTPAGKSAIGASVSPHIAYTRRTRVAPRQRLAVDALLTAAI